MAEEFLLRVAHIIADSRKSYFRERMQIDSNLSSKGTFRSSVAWTQNSELAVNNLSNTIDEVFKFALSYASTEGMLHQELIESACAGLVTYKDELAADLDKRIEQIGSASLKGICDEKKTQLSTIISEKSKLALKGWINSEKVYSGSLISPSLKFFNLLCRNYDDVIEKKAPHLKKRLEAAYESMASDNPSH